MSIKKDGRRVVVFASGARFKLVIEDAGRAEPYFSPRSYVDAREAKLAAFDAFTTREEANRRRFSYNVK